MFTSLPMPDSLTVGTSNVVFSQSVKTHGVTLDTHLNFENRVVNPVRTANSELRRISSVRHYLSVESTQKLVQAFDMSRLDYCNSLLYGCHQYLINRPCKVQNNAACLILKVPKTGRITRHLQTVHRLPVGARIWYKIHCFNVIDSSCPQYLAKLLEIYAPSCQLRSSADTCILSIPLVHTKTYSQRAFSHSAPTLWNNFSKAIRNSESDPFKSALKT